MTRTLAILLLFQGCAVTYQLPAPPRGETDGYLVERSGNILTGYEYSRLAESTPDYVKPDFTWAFSQYPELEGRVSAYNGLQAAQTAVSIAGASLSAYFLLEALNGGYKKNMRQATAVMGSTLACSVVLNLVKNYVYGSLGDRYNDLLEDDAE